MLYRLESRLSALFIVLILSFAVMAVAIVSALASTLDEAAAATFKLWNGDRPVCSATYIGRGSSGGDHFLTAAHCLGGNRDAVNVRVEVRDDKLNVLKQTAYFVKVQRELKSKDVALLRTLVPLDFIPVPADIASPGEFSAVIGAPVMAIGYPHTEILTLTTGVFSGPAPGVLGLDSPLYRATAAVAPGSSGGGLWAEIGGSWKIVGTVSAFRRGSEFMNLFTTPEKIADLLRFYAPLTPVKD